MPYIRLELDAMKLFPAVAAAAGIPTGSVCYGLVQLWAYCWGEKRTTVTPGHLAGFFGGDPDRAGSALATFGFVEKVDGDYRVRGTEKYLQVAESRTKGASITNAKRWKKVAGATLERQVSDAPATLNRSLPVALTPNTYHLTPNTKEEEDVFSYWCVTMGRPRAKFDKKRRAAVRGQLKAGRSVEEIYRAIDGCRASDWHMREKQNDLELICRDAVKFEGFLEKVPEPQAPTPIEPCALCGTVSGYIKPVWGVPLCARCVADWQHTCQPGEQEIQQWIETKRQPEAARASA